MAERVPSNVFVKELVAALNRKDGYIMGGKGENPRTGYIDLSVPESKCKSSWKVNGWYYTQYNNTKEYSAKQKAKALYWREHATRVMDCNGCAEWVYEMYTGINIDSKARYNYAQWCDPKGSGTIPTQYRVPGAAVFWGTNASSIHHVAYLWKPVNEGHPEGDWYLIEAQGVLYGVVSSKLYSRKPNYWGWMTKYYDYSDSGVDYTPVELHLGDRILKNDMEGNDVKELQTNLIRLGYDCGKWGADGDFGDATEMAVRRFQVNNGLVVDGEFGPKSLAAMNKAMAELDKPIEEPPKEVKIEGGNCYVRSEPNTSGDKYGVAHEGDRLLYQNETSENGWLRVMFKDKIGWVSGKYGKLVS